MTGLFEDKKVNIIYFSTNIFLFCLQSWPQEHRDCLKRHSSDISVIIQIVQTALRYIYVCISSKAGASCEKNVYSS